MKKNVRKAEFEKPISISTEVHTTPQMSKNHKEIKSMKKASKYLKIRSNCSSTCKSKISAKGVKASSTDTRGKGAYTSLQKPRKSSINSILPHSSGRVTSTSSLKNSTYPARNSMKSNTSKKEKQRENKENRSPNNQRKMTDPSSKNSLSYTLKVQNSILFPSKLLSPLLPFYFL